MTKKKDYRVKKNRAYRKAELERRRRHSHAYYVERFHQKQSLFKYRYGARDSSTLLIAPSPFSLLENREEVIKFINDAWSLTLKKIPVRLDLYSIGHTDLPAICLLSAFMLDKRNGGINVRGPLISSPAFKMMQETQFDEMVVGLKRGSFTNGAFLSRREYKFNKEHLEPILQQTQEYFGLTSRRSLSGLHPIITEIITNTNNHAAPEGEQLLPWLINTHERTDGQKKVKSFCVVDLGVGIYESVRDKTQQFEAAKKKPLRWMAGIKNKKPQNVFFKDHVPEGIQSTTDKIERGKGIKHIYELALSSKFIRFEVITNRAFIDLKHLSPVGNDSTNNLEGTIYYWEMTVGK